MNVDLHFVILMVVLRIHILAPANVIRPCCPIWWAKWKQHRSSTRMQPAVGCRVWLGLSNLRHTVLRSFIICV